MKLDLTLMRSILEQVEAAPVKKNLDLEKIDPGVRNRDEIPAHVELLAEEGYMDALIFKDGNGHPHDFVIYRLKMKGHEFIRNASNDTIWKKVTDDAKEKGIALPMHLLNSALQKAAEKFLGL